ncbi:septation protein SepH [Staphylococcus chromogenes]|nr:septation protein SepH [Staphylococcus chromogenes]
MRELKLIADESTGTSLVFRLLDENTDCFVEVTDEVAGQLRTLLDGQPAALPKPEEKAPEAIVEKPAPRPESREIDPRLSTPLKMRPRDIQDRIRSGKTITEVAEENGVTEARIEPFAHPVLIERARIADMAKRAHPVRADGPAKLTLWEVLATAFAARGNDLSDSEWDAYKDASGQWVVRVHWQAGHSDNVAEWSYHPQGMSSATAVARNAVAADLTDPDFGQPAVRTLSSVSRVDTADEPDQQHSEVQETAAQDSDFLQHPEAEQRPAKRRRKAVTPHWEDVLLGVRTNTKRPRS